MNEEDPTNNNRPPETSEEEKIPEAPANTPTTGRPGPVLWMTVAFTPTDASGGGALNYSTNVKELTTLLGMIELAKATVIEKHFERNVRQRPQLIVPRSSLKM